MTRGSTLRSDCYFNFTGHRDGASESDRVSSHHGGEQEYRTTGH